MVSSKKLSKRKGKEAAENKARQQQKKDEKPLRRGVPISECGGVNAAKANKKKRRSNNKHGKRT